MPEYLETPFLDDSASDFLSETEGNAFSDNLRKPGATEVGLVRRQGRLREDIPPAQVIAGRAPSEGLLVNEFAYREQLHLVVALSVGKCAGIDSIIVDGEEHGMVVDPQWRGLETALFVPSGKYSKRVFGTDRLSLITVFPYLEADGEGGSTIRRFTQLQRSWALRTNHTNRAKPSDIGDETKAHQIDGIWYPLEFRPIPIAKEWTTEYRGDGIAYAHIVLSQDRATTWQERPKSIKLVVRGILPRVPAAKWGMSAVRRQQLGIELDEFSNDSPSVRFWWMTNIRGISPRKIDYPSFIAAKLLASEQIGIQLKQDSSLSNYSNTFNRYTTNGIISYDDNPERVEKEMDAAMAGRVVYDGGRYYFLPGRRVEAKWKITPDMLLQRPVIQAGNPATQNTVGIRMSIAASSDHNYKALDLSQVNIFGEEGARGEVIDYGSRPLINNVWQAIQLMHQTLSKKRSTMKVETTIMPGSDGQYLNIRIGDGISILGDKRIDPKKVWIVDVREIERAGEGLGVHLGLSEQSDHNLHFTAPPRKEGQEAPRGDPSAPHEAPDWQLDTTDGYTIPE